MSYIDTHVHLDQKEFASDRDEVLRRSREAGVDAVICAGVSAASSRAIIMLAQARAKSFGAGASSVDQSDSTEFYAAVGIQPNSCAEATEGDWPAIVAMAEEPRVVAIGETGLDRYWDYSPIELQREYFDRHLELASKLDLPIIIHCREAEEDLLPMLRSAADRQPFRGVIHSFSGDTSFAQSCLELGLYISFAGAVTYRNRKFGTLREAAKTIPDDRILIETDSPYLMPHPLRGKVKRNEPANIAHTAACLAELRGAGLERFAALTTANAQRLFGLA